MYATHFNRDLCLSHQFLLAAFYCLESTDEYLVYPVWNCGKICSDKISWVHLFDFNKMFKIVQLSYGVIILNRIS